jgi:hypothetical protein
VVQDELDCGPRGRWADVRCHPRDAQRQHRIQLVASRTHGHLQRDQGVLVPVALGECLRQPHDLSGVALDLRDDPLQV